MSIYDKLSVSRPGPISTGGEADTDTQTLPEEVIESPELPRFQVNELSFSRPEGMIDESVQVLARRSTASSAFTINLVRAVVGPDDALEAMADRLQQDLANTVDPTFHQSFTPFEVGGSPGLRTRFSWRRNGEHRHQDLTAFFHVDEMGQRLFLQIVGTSNRMAGMSDDERDELTSLLESVELRTAEHPEVDDTTDEMPHG